MPTTTFPEFEAAAEARGFDEVLARRWDPDVVLHTHRHAFAVEALVVAGEMWLTVGNETRPRRCGDTFTLERDVPHAERCGPAGATYWVARRNARRRAPRPCDERAARADAALRRCRHPRIDPPSARSRGRGHRCRSLL